MDIVVGFIQSEEGRAALERAVAEARLRNARLLIVHSSKGGRHEDETESVAYQESLEQIDQRLNAQGLDHEVIELVRGNTPSQDLLDVARRSDAELIVIGVRRRSPVGKLILGSNAQEVLLDADCPVLAVKPPTQD